MAAEPEEPAELGVVDGLVQLSFLVQAVLAEAAARHDLTVAQVRLLGILRDREPGMMHLAQHLGLDKSSVTGLVDRAERRGLVQRRSVSEDGRAVRVGTTALGRHLTEQAEVDINQRIGAIAGVLNDEDRQTLTTNLGRLGGATGTATLDR